MAWAVKCADGDRERIVGFARAGARLPVSANRGAQLIWMPWGRRPREPGTLPQGGWAHLTHLQNQAWDRYMPRPVRLPALSFAERDVTGREHWFTITRGQFLQGCVARHGNERRVYVVTIDCAPDMGEFEHWPRLILGPI